MISERKLVSSHSSFWRQLMPMGDSFVRYVNSSLERYVPPVDSSAHPERNAFISELSFRLYQLRFSNDNLNGAEGDVVITRLLEEVPLYISRLDGGDAAPMTDAELQDAKTWSISLESCFKYGSPGQDILPRPKFLGCGILDRCEGDVLVGKTLWELKNVERDFRLVDIKQLLTYCALNYASKQYIIDSVGLVNARKGLYFKTDLESLAQATSAMPAVEMLGEIVRYITSDAPSR